MGRSGLIVAGFAVLIVGYALVYSGLTTIHPENSPTGQPVGAIDSLIPGKVQPTTNPKAAATKVAA
jgi:hypothetical protein